MHPSISIIGTGKVGSTLARLWYQAGYTITALYNRTPERAAQLAQHTQASLTNNLVDAVKPADIVFLTVPDDAIEPLANALRTLNWDGKAVVHTSGVASLDKLNVLAEAGAMIGSLHPAFPFAEIETALANLAGASFAIEADNEMLQGWLKELVFALDGRVLVIPAGKKALYHAALVLVSNYTVTLYAVAQNLLKSLDAEQSAIDNALMVLLQASVKNIAQQGIPDALTGPLTRADVGTLAAHLDALNDETLTQAYIALARLSYPILEQRGINTHIIEKLLQDKT